MSRDLRPADEEGEENSEPRVVEGEVLEGGAPRRPADAFAPESLSWPKRMAARAAIAGFLALAALVLCAIGILLTLTVVGAIVGLPLLFFGVVLGAVAVWIFLGGGALVLWK